MADCLDYSCNESLGAQELNLCGEELLGGISALILLECEHQLTDPSSADQIATEIAAGRATKVVGIKVGIAKPSPVEIESNVSCGITKLVTYDRTGTLIDGNVNAANITFYNKVFGGRVFGGAILYLCGTQESAGGELVEWIDAAITFTGGKVTPNTNNAFQTFEGDFKWRKKAGAALYAAPAGVF